MINSTEFTAEVEAREGLDQMNYELKDAIERNPTPYFIPAACDCKPIDPINHEFIYSKAKGKYYCDIICMVNKEAEWSGDNVLVDGLPYTVDEYIKLEEVQFR